MTRKPVIEKLQILLLPLSRFTLFRWCCLQYYWAAVFIVKHLLQRFEWVEAACIRSSPGSEHFKPLISDLDLLLICSDSVAADSLKNLDAAFLWLRVPFPFISDVNLVVRTEFESGKVARVVEFLLFNDSEILKGNPSFEGAKKNYEPQNSPTPLGSVAGYYTSSLPRWLLGGQGESRVLNWSKVFLKLLRYQGYDWDRLKEFLPVTSRTLCSLQEKSGAAIIDVRAEAACVPMALESVFLEIFDFLERRLGECLNGSEARWLERFSQLDRVPPSVVRVAEQNIASVLAHRNTIKGVIGELLPCRDVFLCGSADGPRSFALYVLIDRADLSPETLAGFRRAWPEKQATLENSLSMLDGPLKLPILVSPALFAHCVTLDISRKLWAHAVYGPLDYLALSPKLDRLLLEVETAAVAHHYAEYSLCRPGLGDILVFRLPTLLLALETGEMLFEPQEMEARLEQVLPAAHQILLEIKELVAAGALEKSRLGGMLLEKTGSLLVFLRERLLLTTH